MFLQVLAQAYLVTRLRQVLAVLILVVCLEAQPQTQEAVYLVQQLLAVSLDSNQLLNVSVAFLQILTLSVQVLNKAKLLENEVTRNWDNVFVAMGAHYIKE